MNLCKPLFLCILMFVVSGCGLTAAQKASVQNFGLASSTASKIAADELVAMRNDTIAMNTHRIELIGLSPKYPGLDKLQGEFKPDDVLTILKAINAIKAYGAALDALVKDTQRDELSKAATNLTSSIDSLPNSYVTVTKDQQDAIQKLVVEIGSMAVDEKKKTVVKEIVTKYKDQIAKLAGLLSNEFDETPGNTLAASFLVTSSRSIVISVDALNKCRDVICREKAVGNYNEAKAGQEKGKVVSTNVSKAFADLKKANVELLEKIKKDEYEEKDIKEFAATVKILVEASKVLAK